MVSTTVLRPFNDGKGRRATPLDSGRRIGPLLSNDLARFKTVDSLFFGYVRGLWILAMALSILHGVHVIRLPVGVSQTDMQSTPAESFFNSLPKDAIAARSFEHADEALLRMQRGEIDGVVKIGLDSSRVPHYRFKCTAGIDDNNRIEESVLDTDI